MSDIFGSQKTDLDELAASFEADTEVDDGPDPNGPPPEPEFQADDWPGEGATIASEEADDVVEEEPEPEPETAAEQQARLLANKYQTPEELERAYLEVTSGFTKLAQENAAMRAQQEEITQRVTQTQAQQEQVIQFLMNQMAEQDPEFAEQLQRQQQLEALVDQRLQPVVQQTQTQQQTLAQQQAAQALQQRQMSAAEAFYRANPDITPGDQRDQSVAQSFLTLQQAGLALDMANPEHYQLAREAAENPQFQLDLMMAPKVLEVPGGLARLRERASATIAASATPPAENGTRARGPVRRKVESFVEAGSGGTPEVDSAPGAPKDEFAEAWEWYQSDRNAKGPLFGSQR